MAKERDFRRENLPKKCIAKILYEWDNGKFENKYLKKYEKTSKNGSQFFWRRNIKNDKLYLFSLFFYFLFILFPYLELRVAFV